MRISDWSSDVCSSDLPDRQTAIRLIVSVDQIGWRMWLIGDPVHQRGAERRHRLLRDDPGGDRRAETFAVEGTQRRRLPELNVAGGPVVEQAAPGDALPGFTNRPRLAPGICPPPAPAEFQPETQPPACPEPWPVVDPHLSRWT